MSINNPINESFATSSFANVVPKLNAPIIYTDANGLSNLKLQAREDKEKALPEVARQFESVFIGMILKGMRQASLGDAMISSSAIDSYQDMHDQQMSIELAKGKGFGFAQAIVKQLQQDKQTTTEPDLNPDGSLTLPVRKNFYQHDPYKKEIDNTSSLQAERINGNSLPEEIIVFNKNHQRKTKQMGVSNDVIKIDHHFNLDTQPINFATAKEFVNKLWPMAEKSAKELGVKPEVLLSQAALETGWGQSIIKNNQTSSYNLFNIKADARWQGEKISKPSIEYVNNTPINKNSFFRAYDSLQDSFDDYVKFIKNNPRYEDAIKKVSDAEQYLHGIHKAGYATDPKYVEKIMKVMNSSDIKEKLSKST